MVSEKHKYKKCAVCGREDFFLSQEEKQKVLDRFAPTGEGPNAFYKLWHIPTEECGNCRYISLDISTAEHGVKELVLSKDYQSLFQNHIIDSISEFEDNNAQSQLAFAAINDLSGNVYESALGFLRAFFELRQSANLWAKEVSEFDGLDESEAKVLDLAMGLAQNYLENARVRFAKFFKENPSNINVVFLLIYTYYYLEEKTKAQTLVKKLEGHNLNPKQKAILKYLSTLVFFDKYDWS